MPSTSELFGTNTMSTFRKQVSRIWEIIEIERKTKGVEKYSM